MSPFDGDQRTIDRRFTEIIGAELGDELRPAPEPNQIVFLWIAAADLIALALIAWGIAALIAQIA